MLTVDVDGVEIAYQRVGSGPPLLLLTGLGGVGRAWGEHVDRFAQDFTTIVPDHRGTGSSSKPRSGYTIQAMADDMAGLVRHIGLGPAHVVGSSTGGAIAQVMALDHRDTLTSMTLVSSWAGPDPYFARQFEVRKSILTRQGVDAYTRASALFLFGPGYAASHPEAVEAWIDRATSQPGDAEIMAQRIDMILVHDQRDRLGAIDVPTLVLVGRDDICTPPFASEELATLIPGARLVTLPGGHFVYLEHPDVFHRTVSEFVTSAHDH